MEPGTCDVAVPSDNIKIYIMYKEKSKMKKLVSIMLAGGMALSMVACGGANTSGNTTGVNSTQASNVELNVVIAHNQTSAENPYSQAALKFKEALEEVSGGRATATVHNGDLGENESELVEKLEMGAVDVTVASPGFMTAIGVKEIDIFSLLYLFDSFEHWEACMDGEFGDAMKEVILPKLQSLENALISKMLEYRHTEQIGRTHGQYAIPMTMGWWWAEYVSRIGRAIRLLRCYPRAGQISGAVGTYNALSHIYPDPVEFAEAVLKRLHLSRAEYSSQIIPADSMVRFLSEVNVCFGILANLADDIRNLQRSEIGEVREEFTDQQVGSSTMPQKRNPWNCEHVKSLWKEFMPRYITFSMDLISEHQRDLTNSASSRFIPEYLTGFYLAICRTEEIIRGLKVNTDKMAERTQTSSAEKAYVLLALSGVWDAHEIVRRITVIAEQDNIDFESTFMRSDWWKRIRDHWYDVPADPTQNIIDSLKNEYYCEVEESEE